MRQCEAVKVVLLAYPSPAVNQILLHMAGERDWSSKPYRAEPQEIPGKPRQRDAFRLSARRRGDSAELI